MRTRVKALLGVVLWIGLMGLVWAVGVALMQGGARPSAGKPTLVASATERVKPTLAASATPVPSATATRTATPVLATASVTPSARPSATRWAAVSTHEPWSPAPEEWTPAPMVATWTVDGAKVMSSTVALSPDGQWLAESVASTFDWQDGQAFFRIHMHFTQQKTGVGWAPVDLAPGPDRMWAWPTVIAWSADPRYCGGRCCGGRCGQGVYYAIVPMQSVYGGCAEMATDAGLYYLDLQTGVNTALLPLVTQMLAVAPDRRAVAYVAAQADGQLAVGVYDLLSGATQEAVLQGSVVGGAVDRLVWAPDGSALIAHLVPEASWTCWEKVPQPFVRVEARAVRMQTVLQENADGRLWVKAWTEVGRVAAGANSVLWWMDARTGVLTPREP